MSGNFNFTRIFDAKPGKKRKKNRTLTTTFSPPPPPPINTKKRRNKYYRKKRKKQIKTRNRSSSSKTFADIAKKVVNEHKMKAGNKNRKIFNNSLLKYSENNYDSSMSEPSCLEKQSSMIAGINPLSPHPNKLELLRSMDDTDEEILMNIEIDEYDIGEYSYSVSSEEEGIHHTK